MSTAAAAAVVYAVVVGVVAVPARCRPSALNTRKKHDNIKILLCKLQPRCLCHVFYYTSSHRDRGIVRVCATAVAAAAVVMYSLRSFPHRDRCLPPLQLLFMLLVLALLLFPRVVDLQH